MATSTRLAAGCRVIFWELEFPDEYRDQVPTGVHELNKNLTSDNFDLEVFPPGILFRSCETARKKGRTTHPHGAYTFVHQITLPRIYAFWGWLVRQARSYRGITIWALWPARALTFIDFHLGFKLVPSVEECLRALFYIFYGIRPNLNLFSPNPLLAGPADSYRGPVARSGSRHDPHHTPTLPPADAAADQPETNDWTGHLLRSPTGPIS